MHIYNRFMLKCLFQDVHISKMSIARLTEISLLLPRTRPLRDCSPARLLAPPFTYATPLVCRMRHQLVDLHEEKQRQFYFKSLHFRVCLSKINFLATCE
jgi:hypothetical protein